MLRIARDRATERLENWKSDGDTIEFPEQTCVCNAKSLYYADWSRADGFHNFECILCSGPGAVLDEKECVCTGYGEEYSQINAAGEVCECMTGTSLIWLTKSNTHLESQIRVWIPLNLIEYKNDSRIVLADNKTRNRGVWYPRNNNSAITTVINFNLFLIDEIPQFWAKTVFQNRSYPVF